MKRAVRGASVLGLAMLAVGAAARDAIAAEPNKPAVVRRRKLGFGSGFGQTIAASTLWTAPRRVGTGTGVALVGLALPTFEVQYFPRELYSINLAVSLGGTLLSASFDECLYYTQDAYFTFHLGRGVARFVGGPGVGFTVAHYEDDRHAQGGASLRLVAQGGLELLTKNEAFGFRLLARPWIEFTHYNGAYTDTFASGGFTNMFGFWGYLRD